MAEGISKRLRFEILRRDNYTCRYCGVPASEAKLVIDHVIPRTLGGNTEPGNLAAACVDCNIGKASINPDENVVTEVNADAQEWLDAVKRATERQRSKYAVSIEAKRELQRQIRSCHEMVKALWPSAEQIEASPELFSPDGATPTCPLPEGWTTSVRLLVQRGFTEEDFGHACAEAFNRTVNDRWRYFCGICWRMIKQREEKAAIELHGDRVRSDEPTGEQAKSTVLLPLPTEKKPTRTKRCIKPMSPRVAAICEVCEGTGDGCRSAITPCPNLAS